MADLIDDPVFEPVYQWETTDAALGGAGGIMNTPTQQLANRTAYLKDNLEAEELSRAAGDEDLQDQIDAILANFKFRSIMQRTDVYTILPADVGKLIRAEYLDGDDSYAQLTLPLCSSVADGSIIGIINTANTTTRCPIYRQGTNYITGPHGDLITEMGTYYGEAVVFVCDKVANRWRIVAHIRQGGNVPAGTIMPFAGSTAPVGWLKCNGATVNRAFYADLFAVCSTTYNTGGEAGTVFRLPELRGEFVRGWDDARGVDTGRTIGSHQDEMVGPHQHGVANENDAASGGALQRLGGPDDSFQVYENDGTENRPRNVALLYCIKY